MDILRNDIHQAGIMFPPKHPPMISMRAEAPELAVRDLMCRRTGVPKHGLQAICRVMEDGGN